MSTPDEPLTARAIAAARAAGTAHPSIQTDQAWHDRSARAVRILASTLGVHPADVAARPDPARRHGLLNTPEVLLHVSDTPARPSATSRSPGAEAGSAGLAFIPEIGRTDVFLLLLPCPECRQPVPTYRIASLADLGRHLDTDPHSRADRSDTAQFETDPGHTLDCPRRRPSTAYGVGHRHP